MIIIGLGHYSRTGKDSFANYLVQAVEECTDLKIGAFSFASKLKAITHDLYGWAGLQDEAYYNQPEHEHERTIVLPALGMTPVEIWVKFGTPAVRDNVYQGTWVDYLLNTPRDLDVMVIKDVRFYNEVDAIRAKGGHLLKIVRDGYGPRMTVADLALTEYTGWDNIIGDGCKLEDLEDWAYQYAVNLEHLEILHRDEDELAEIHSQEIRPSLEEIELVYRQAGLEYERYAA